ncbi:MAG: ABC transporter permease [Pseudomonadota bacterium]
MPWLVGLGVMLVWEFLCWVASVPDFILPRPSLILRVTVLQGPELLIQASYTLAMTVLGFLLAVAVGLGLGVVIGSSRLVYKGLYPVLIAFNSIPKVAVVPVLVIWFGVGTWPAILAAFLVSFFPIVVNVATGLATIQPELTDVLRSLGASRLQILTKVGIPGSMPYFFASLKIAITLAFVGAVLAETIASNRGVGALIVAAGARFEVPLVFAGLIVIAAMGIAMYALCAKIERRLTFWTVPRSGARCDHRGLASG